ncbi:DEAD/DEAH box helicase family protein [Thorsellia anophelis]|uniref:Helicase conserved C-terminal domain-containing protein n=1 Tax=Thorsellia anophelis DSM 18579 TaxID=1123402 RepID=A0A1I0CDT7_9GAMM|nr:DEAD/DEAH box helicase family protein [Thorsellia anophelis]SES74695.1 Helicase conserved C-terminal domain-containing protein [Thorsellia anophelis DSM 18579]SET14146.1 Helicase conserved C-terminal domain-containing protein [Thorsellia anophelis DSM 18579]SET17740.1 Helicase conserved C-terminal domain-containing protein [Thorsellia anophelis DSM 18579]SET47747.1 Helicase conserved C-terminal domain-containing protein [Thorsellia anophelis DSM 18579]
MVKDFKDIDQLAPADFEIFVRDLFLASGWSDAEITRVGREFKYGDGGVDIFAYKGKRRFAIEVKQRNLSTTVDVKALNQIVTGAKLANVSNKILVTNSYFTSEVKARALRLGVELIDRDELQNLWVVKHSEIGRDIKPRKYQQYVIDEALHKYNAGKNKILIEMATGLGKTYTVAHLIKRLIHESSERPRILFLAHQVEILLQSVTAFKNVLGIGNYSFSACFSGTKPEDTDFVFASFDTLYGQLGSLCNNSYDFIVVDEAHHTAARTYSEVVTLFKPKLLVGLTATPYRADNKDVISFFGGADGHIGKFDLVWALKHKKLAFPRYLVLLDDLDQDKINQLESGLSISDLDKKLFLHKKDQEVVRIVEKTVEEQGIQRVKGIVFCRNIRHMYHLIGFFQLGSATLVHSKMQDLERRENIRSFREGNVKYILVCDLFNEGIDIPETNLLIFMRYTGSRTIWLQQLGRGLRKTPNKDYVHVLDFVGSLERLNEVKELSRSIDRMPVDRENLIDDAEEPEVNSVFHDMALDVKYSEEAAKVLKLIENMKLELNSRELLLEKLRRYKEINESIPDISNIENCLEDVGLDQIATHFGSYYGYLTAAFDGDFDKQEMILRMKKYISGFYEDYKLEPSLKAIAVHFTVNHLNEFTEKDIKTLIPEASEFIREVTPNVPTNLGENSSISGAPSPCPIIEKYRNNLLSRLDVKKLSDAERDEIIKKYSSISVFLKKLKSY